MGPTRSLAVRAGVGTGRVTLHLAAFDLLSETGLTTSVDYRLGTRPVAMAARR